MHNKHRRKLTQKTSHYLNNQIKNIKKQAIKTISTKQKTAQNKVKKNKSERKKTIVYKTL